MKPHEPLDDEELTSEAFEIIADLRDRLDEAEAERDELCARLAQRQTSGMQLLEVISAARALLETYLTKSRIGRNNAAARLHRAFKAYGDPNDIERDLQNGPPRGRGHGNGRRRA